MSRKTAVAALCCLFALQPYTAASQPPSHADALGYADLADLALPAPLVAHAEIKRANRLDEERAVGVEPGHVRFYVEAELISLIRSPQAMPERIRYLVDVPLGPDGRRPRIDDREVLVMASPVPARPGEVRLVAPDAQIDWTAERERTIRAILTEAASADAPGAVTGVGSAFSVAGTLPGESETQIFLATGDGRPVSLSVLRRPNQRPRWSVALGEIVENAMPPPQPNSLLWYRLACFLPPTLPESSMESMAPEQVRMAQADYRMVIQDLGPCPRGR